MKKKAEKFTVNLFCSLMLLSFIPFLYTLVKTNLIADIPSTGGLGIAGHMEWFDLINETVQAFLIIPLFSLLIFFSLRQIIYKELSADRFVQRCPDPFGQHHLFCDRLQNGKCRRRTGELLDGKQYYLGVHACSDLCIGRNH